MAIPTSIKAVFLCLAASLPAGGTGPWEGFGNGPEHQGYYPATLTRNAFVKAWEQDFSRVSTALERPAIGDGMVFMTHMRIYTELSGNYGQVVAMDLKTGSFPWYNPYGLGRRITPPTFHQGRLYFASNVNFRNDSRIHCLNAKDGQQVWMTKFDDTGRWYEAPAVTADGVWLAGNFRGGLHCYAPSSGSERWFRALPDQTGWTPAVSGTRIFTSLQQSFTEHSPVDGSTLWSIETPPSSMSIPVVSGERALVKKGTSLVCIDLAARGIAWTADNAAAATSHPAVADGTVYTLQGNAIRSFSLADGTAGRTSTASAPQDFISEQPIVLNELLIAANPSTIFVFDRRSGEQLQALRGGGKMCFASGHLVSVGTDAIIRCFRANSPPAFTAIPVPGRVTALPAAADQHLALGQHVADPDPGDPLRWSILSIDGPPIFRSLEIHAETGGVHATYDPWQEGETRVTFEVADASGDTLEFTIRFVLPAHSPPQLEFTPVYTLNPQTGLYEQTVTVTNTSAREIAGFDLTLSGLPSHVWVYNATWHDGENPDDGSYRIRHREPLAPGASVSLVLEYFNPQRGTSFTPQPELALGYEAAAPLPGGRAELEIDRCESLPDRSLLIEFTSRPGFRYEVEYSDDAVNWIVSPITLFAGGTRLQWIDRGPPRTHTPPSSAKSRFYRVREIAP